MIDLDELLRNKIKQSGLSLNKIASRANVPQPTLSRFLKGTDIRISTAKKLMALFHVEPNEKTDF